MNNLEEADIRRRLGELTLTEKCELLTGADFWTLVPIPRIGLRRIALSDGPNGVRGLRWDERDVSLLLPAASAVAATWDVAAARRIGELFAMEAKRKRVHVILAPTVNIQRTPYGGRHFENLSEDPVLVAEIGAAIVSGIQSIGVGAMPKHFVCNDSETERMTYDVRVGSTALHEVYLRPFEVIVRRCRPWAIMAAYNGVNGATMTENRSLNVDLLKHRWGFDGVLVSDWTAARTTDGTALGGLDLIMPNVGSPWSHGQLVDAVESGDVPAAEIDDKVLRVLRLAARAGLLGQPFDGPDDGEPDLPSPEPLEGRFDREVRELTARSFVLLRNEEVHGERLLPLDLGKLRRLAVIGENAILPTTQGGGSSRVFPPYVVSPLDGLRTAMGADVELTWCRGARHRRMLDDMPADRVSDPEGGKPGLRVDYLNRDGDPVQSELRGLGRKSWFSGALPSATASVRIRALLRLDGPGDYEMSIQGSGQVTLTVAGKRRFSGVVDPLNTGDPIGDRTLPPETRVPVQITAGDLDAGGRVELVATRVIGERDLIISLGIGLALTEYDARTELDRAVGAARAADAVIVVVGTNDEVETEGADRTWLGLPGPQDELVDAVLAANPRTIVVVNAGSPVVMPWAGRAAALLWTWFGSQEYGGALADALLGLTEPAGRLPATLPASQDQVIAPSHIPIDCELKYDEGDLIGYRAYLASTVMPAFPFGHGLGYTDWAYLDATADGTKVTVTLRNTGDRAGCEVIQVYGEQEPARLIGFAAVTAAAGEQVTTTIDIDPGVLARWDEREQRWRRPDRHIPIAVSRNATHVRLRTVLRTQ